MLRTIGAALHLLRKIFSRDLYFSSSSVALKQVAAPFGVGFVQQVKPRNFSSSSLRLAWPAHLLNGPML
jgi:hypothetical protein